MAGSPFITKTKQSRLENAVCALISVYAVVIVLSSAFASCESHLPGKMLIHTQQKGPALLKGFAHLLFI